MKAFFANLAHWLICPFYWLVYPFYWLARLIVGKMLMNMGREESADKLLTGPFRFFVTSFVADILLAEFEERATQEQIIASSKMFFGKWNAGEAARFLIGCKPEAAALILNQWNSNPKFREHASKVPEVAALMLTEPCFASETDKIVRILDLITVSNQALTEELLRNMPFDAVMAYLGKTTLPEISPILSGLPSDALVPVFFALETNHPDAFDLRIGKLPPATIGLVRAKIREIEEHAMKIREYGSKMTGSEAKDALTGKLIPPPVGQLPCSEMSEHASDENTETKETE